MSRRHCDLGMILLVFFILTFLMFQKPAYAYLDPGSGSYILQMLAGGLLAASFAIKTFWKNIKSFFTNLFSKKKKDERNPQ